MLKPLTTHRLHSVQVCLSSEITHISALLFCLFKASSISASQANFCFLFVYFIKDFFLDGSSLGGSGGFSWACSMAHISEPQLQRQETVSIDEGFPFSELRQQMWSIFDMLRLFATTGKAPGANVILCSACRVWRIVVLLLTVGTVVIVIWVFEENRNVCLLRMAAVPHREWASCRA